MRGTIAIHGKPTGFQISPKPSAFQKPHYRIVGFVMRPTAAHLPAWVLVNFTSSHFSLLMTKPKHFSHAMIPLTGVPWNNKAN
jgi:hypothetical protein